LKSQYGNRKPNLAIDQFPPSPVLPSLYSLPHVPLNSRKAIARPAAGRHITQSRTSKTITYDALTMDTSYLEKQVSTIINKLHELFDEIGVPSHERDSRESELFAALSDTLHNQLKIVTKYVACAVVQFSRRMS
jgi:hypothetical protein